MVIGCKLIVSSPIGLCHLQCQGVRRKGYYPERAFADQNSWSSIACYKNSFILWQFNASINLGNDDANYPASSQNMD